MICLQNQNQKKKIDTHLKHHTHYTLVVLKENRNHSKELEYSRRKCAKNLNICNGLSVNIEIQWRSYGVNCNFLDKTYDPQRRL